jgi:hypothetical protein
LLHFFDLTCRWNFHLLHGNAFVANDMESEKEQSQPPREQPVNSIENDSAITPELWKIMMDVVLAIYEYREEECD